MSAHNFCFSAEDAAGMRTERRCVTLSIGVKIINQNAPTTTTSTTMSTTTTTSTTTSTSITTTTSTIVTTFTTSPLSTETTTPSTTPTSTSEPMIKEFDIFRLIDHMIPEMNGKLENYGCAGKGHFETTSKNVGKPIDSIDKALSLRKQCIRCSNATYAVYRFDTQKSSCENHLESNLRSFCECDLEFVEKILEIKSEFVQENINATCKGSFSNDKPQTACCKKNNGSFKKFNKSKFDCCEGRIVNLGQC